jgi:glycosyltransferase involved in cell wall biosynthesis
MKKEISVIVCTRNRASDLKQTLDAIGKCRLSCFAPELIVVDNGSNDETADVAGNFRTPGWRVSYVFEPTPSLGGARNRGLANARGDIILFTDDDVRPDPDWIPKMCAPIVEGRAQAVAGAVEIPRHLQRAWMSAFHRVCLASTDALDSENIETVTGANFAISRAVLDKVPAFDRELGPGALGFCEDTLFSLQVVEAGYRLIAVFDCPVLHHFNPSRLSRSSFVRRAQAEGRSRAYMAHHWEHSSIPFPMLRTAAAFARLELRRRKTSDTWPHPEGISEWEFKSIYRLSFRQQYLRERRRPRHYTKHGLVRLEQNVLG